MVKKKIIKKKVVEKKAVKKKVKLEKKPKQDKELIELAAKRQAIIDEIVPKLLNNGQLRSGGTAIRDRYSVEVASYLPVLQEINEMGAKLGFKPIGLGHLRK